jgi:hypothetical protein
MLLAIAMVKPASYVLTKEWCPLSSTTTNACPGTPTWHSRLQLGAILCASAAVNWLSHAERRIGWLAAPRVARLDEDRQPPSHQSIEHWQLSSCHDCDLFDNVAAALEWEPLTSVEKEAYSALRREEEADLHRRLGEGPTAADWQCDGRVLGAGPCGYVLRAVDGDGLFLALKRVRVPPAAGRDLERRLRPLVATRHPHLAEYVAVAWRTAAELGGGGGGGGGGGALCVLTELCDSGSVADLLHRFGPLGEPTARRFAAHAAAGLAYLHRHGGAHGGLTCANLLVGAGGVARLADYGAARAVGRALRQPVEGAALLALAPEAVWREAGGAPADVWALGCCVWEMAAGAPPFTADAVFQMAQVGSVPSCLYMYIDI